MSLNKSLSGSINAVITVNGLVVGANDIDLGANDLKTTNHILNELNATYLKVNKGFVVGTTLYVTGESDFVSHFNFVSGGAAISAYNVDANYFMLRARDSGVGLVAVAKVVGAVDPYFEATLPMRLLPGAVPGAPLEGHFWYDSATHKLMYYDNVGAKTVAV